MLWAGMDAWNRQPVDRMFVGFDTWIEIELPRHKSGLFERFQTYVEETDALWDRYSPQSVLSKMNQGNEAVTVDRETFMLFTRTREIADLSGGYFTIFAGSLSDLWGFGSQPRLPSQDEILHSIELIRESRIELREESREIVRHGQATLDFGGAAKGFLVERLQECMREEGVKQGLLNAGGTIYSLGRDTVVGILHPREDSLVGSLSVRDRAVSTSGDYYRYFEENGVRYHHILNPHDGYPGQDFASATVVAESALKTDVLSTAIMAGGKKAFALIDEHFPGISLIAVTPQGEILTNRAGEAIFNVFERDGEGP